MKIESKILGTSTVVFIIALTNLVIPFPRTQTTANILNALLLFGVGGVCYLLICIERKMMMGSKIAKMFIIGSTTIFIVISIVLFNFPHIWFSNLLTVVWMFMAGGGVFSIYQTLLRIVGKSL